jgi:release factor glutamine methyltransferase
MNIQTALNQANQKLKKNNIVSYKLDSEILMSNVVKEERDYVILNLKRNLSNSQLINYRKLVHERSRGKPISYLVGKKEFWNHEFYIEEGVLIPRPDTEVMIEQILKLSKNKSKLKVLEVGIGSGCILLSLLKEKKDFYGIGIDISKKCIDISKINSKKLGLKNRVKFFKTDVDNFNYGKYDLIISNPPYIKKLDLKYLEKDVIAFEPEIALDGGLDGISEIRKVINKSSELIKIGGKLILEIAFDQKNEVLGLLREEGFYINKTLRDLAKNDRCIISTKT